MYHSKLVTIPRANIFIQDFRYRTAEDLGLGTLTTNPVCRPIFGNGTCCAIPLAAAYHDQQVLFTQVAEGAFSSAHLNLALFKLLSIILLAVAIK